MEKPIVKKLKYIDIIWTPEIKELRLYGDNKFVTGEIFIKPTYFLSIVSTIQRIWRQKR